VESGTEADGPLLGVHLGVSQGIVGVGGHDHVGRFHHAPGRKLEIRMLHREVVPASHIIILLYPMMRTKKYKHLPYLGSGFKPGQDQYMFCKVAVIFDHLLGLSLIRLFNLFPHTAGYSEPSDIITPLWFQFLASQNYRALAFITPCLALSSSSIIISKNRDSQRT